MNLETLSAGLEALAVWAWHTSLVTLPALLLLLLLGAWGSFPARARLVVGALILVRLLLPMVPSIPGHPLRWLEQAGAEVMQERATPPAMTATTIQLAETPTGTGSGTVTREVPSLSRVVLLTGIWALGVVVVGAWGVVSHSLLRRLIRQRARPADAALVPLLDEAAHRLGPVRKPALLEVPGLPTVALWGWFRTCILVPPDLTRDYTEEEIRGMFLHEMAHVRRNDVLWGWIGLGAAALHWFNPLVWLVLRRLRADRELECDRIALAALSGEQRISYGMALLKTLETHLSPAAPVPAGVTATLMSFGKRQPDIQKRIRMIASPQPTTWWHRAVVALVPALALFTYTTAQADGEAEAKAQAKPETDAPKSAEAGVVRDGDQGNKRGPRDGEVKKEGPRDGEVKRTGPRDGEGKKTGPRDGEVRKEGAKDGDGAKREGGEVQDGKVKVRDGEGRRVDLRVGILPGGSFTADDQPVSEEALLEKLKVQAANGMDQVVILQASDTTEYKHIMKALELCSQAKVTNVAFNTGKPGDGDRKGSR